jgi:hypothetical protein
MLAGSHREEVRDGKGRPVWWCGSIEQVSHHHTFAEVSLLRVALCLAAFVLAVEETDYCGLPLSL